jgi:hypothetical protein
MAHWGRGDIAPLFLNLGTGRGWVVSSTPWLHLTLGKVPGTHCGRLGGPQRQLDVEGRGKVLRWGSNPSHPVCSQSLYWLSYPSHFVKKAYCKMNFWSGKILYKNTLYIENFNVIRISVFGQTLKSKLLMWENLVPRNYLSRECYTSLQVFMSKACPSSWFDIIH